MHSERCLSYMDLRSGPSKPRAMCLLEKLIRQCTTKYHNVKKIHCTVINTGVILKILVRAGRPPPHLCNRVLRAKIIADMVILLFVAEILIATCHLEC